MYFYWENLTVTFRAVLAFKGGFSFSFSRGPGTEGPAGSDFRDLRIPGAAVWSKHRFSKDLLVFLQILLASGYKFISKTHWYLLCWQVRSHADIKLLANMGTDSQQVPCVNT